MPKPEIGVDADDLHLQPKAALRRASEMGFRAVELSTVSGDLEPSHLTVSGRRHLAHFVRSLGLELKALVADLPGLRLTDPHTVDERVERTCRILDMARELHVGVVTAQAGALTHPETGTPSPTALDALRRIGEFADSRGVVFALRPAYDGAERSRRVLDDLRCPSIKIGLDPAAMVMVGTDPSALIAALPEQVTLVHARDATAGLGDRAGRETRLGEGEVDLAGLMQLLRAAEYPGPYLLRRIESLTPVEDLREARKLLQSILAVHDT